MNLKGDIIVKEFSNVRKIVVACSSGLVSSAMGAKLLGDILQSETIVVTNAAINRLSDDFDMLVVQTEYRPAIEMLDIKVPVIYVNNYLDRAAYESIKRKIND
ncbi:hypothetical protein RZE82_06760 [Mollicutes bacterium LVI A0039]|nr:hypothetical protein RZE82_06760 [Mollicutes bacterium LVI A0039]